MVLVRPVDGLLQMAMLKYDSQVRKPSALEDEVQPQKVSSQEVKLAQMLIDASTAEEFDISQYEDLYTKRLTELIEAKVKGEEVVAPPDEEEAPVINLMDALKQSLGRAKPAAAGKGRAKKMAPSKRAAAPRKRKSS